MYEIKKRISQKIKDKFCKENKLYIPENICIFAFAGSNQIKKSIGAMVDAFNQLEPGNMIMILALKNQECQIGTYKFLGEYDLRDLVNNPNIFVISSALGEEALSSLYKMSDFLLYPTQGEAPGLQLSEAQLCGCIPIVTNYAGSPEESCFSEFLIRDYYLHRGQFNCYRAIVDSGELAKKMRKAYKLWYELNTTEVTEETKLAHQRYDTFIKDVEQKFQNRSWYETAKELDLVFKSVSNPNNIRIDSELVKF